MAGTRSLDQETQGYFFDLIRSVYSVARGLNMACQVCVIDEEKARREQAGLKRQIRDVYKVIAERF